MTVAWTDSLRRILVDLKFIANINEGEKPCFNKRFYVSNNSWYGSAVRLLYNESGRDAYLRITAIFHEAIEQYAKATAEHQCIISTHIKSASFGLCNLIISYQRVPDVHDSLEVLMAEITKWLENNDIKK